MSGTNPKQVLSNQIDQVIRDNLPQNVGDVLCQELARLQSSEDERTKLEDSIENLRAQNHKLTQTVSALRTQIQKQKDLEAKEQELQDKEQRLRCEKDIVTAVQSERDNRITDLKEVVGAVFSNNHFKYSRTRTVNKLGVPIVDSDGYVGTHCAGPETTSEEVEGEGDIPSS